MTVLRQPIEEKCNSLISGKRYFKHRHINITHKKFKSYIVHNRLIAKAYTLTNKIICIRQCNKATFLIRYNVRGTELNNVNIMAQF